MMWAAWWWIKMSVLRINIQFLNELSQRLWISVVYLPIRSRDIPILEQSWEVGHLKSVIKILWDENFKTAEICELSWMRKGCCFKPLALLETSPGQNQRLMWAQWADCKGQHRLWGLLNPVDLDISLKEFLVFKSLSLCEPSGCQMCERWAGQSWES